MECIGCSDRRPAVEDAPIALCTRCIADVMRFVKEQSGAWVSTPHWDKPVAAEPADVIVYYVRLGDMVKIGQTCNLKKRLAALSLTSSQVVATEPGGAAMEARRHRQFSHLRKHGEWFELGPDLLEHIAILTQSDPEAKPSADAMSSLLIAVRKG